MWKVNKNLKAVEDRFTITQVDCFTKPHALLADSICPGIYTAYCYMTAFVKSYGASHGLTENLDWSFGIHPYVMKMLGYTYHVHYCRDSCELNNNLTDCLNKDIAVLLPGNLYHIYYSWSYRQVHALHLFLINGYNSATDVFNVVDNLQNMRSPVPVFADISKDYTYFNMKGEDLRGAWMGLEDLYHFYYSHKFITVEGKQEEIHVPDALWLLRRYAQIAENASDEERFREIYCAKAIIQYFNQDGNDVIKEIRQFYMEMIFGNKEAFFKMTLDLLEVIPYVSSQELKKLRMLSEQILSEWKKFSLVLYKKLYGRSVICVEELKPYYMTAIQKEQQLVQRVKEITERTK